MEWLQGSRRSKRDRLAGLLVLGGLAAFVGVVYVVIVLGGGVLMGHTSSPHLGLSVVATVIVALGFEPVQSRLDRFATEAVHGGRQSPYDVMSQFSKAVTGEYASEELPARMAKLLAEGTGAEWAQVWLVVQNQLTLAATWPPNATSVADPPSEAQPLGRRSRQVRQAGELLGHLVLQEHEDVPLGPVEERLFAGLANQAGLVLRGARLRAELVARAEELSTRAAELRLSRERLVDAQDHERQRLERNIHDGAQQHLVALAVNLRLAQTLAQRSASNTDQVLAEQALAATETIQTLVSLSRGIYPRLLSEQGLPEALRAASATSPLPVKVTGEGFGRYSPSIEAAAYFCSLEALQNAVKHSGAQRVLIHLATEPAGLTLCVEDDGDGFDTATTSAGAGLSNMRDRIESLGGELTIRSDPGRGTTVEARLPAVNVPAQRVG